MAECLSQYKDCNAGIIRLINNEVQQGKNVKPYGAVAVLIFSDPYDSSADGEAGYPLDAGIPEDTVQRGIALEISRKNHKFKQGKYS